MLVITIILEGLSEFAKVEDSTFMRRAVRCLGHLLLALKVQHLGFKMLWHFRLHKNSMLICGRTHISSFLLGVLDTRWLRRFYVLIEILLLLTDVFD